ADDLYDKLVEPALLVELADREAKALVIHLHCRGSETRAAHIGEMRDAERVGDHAALAENGAHHGDVVEMAGAEPGIVGDDDVAGLQRISRIALEHVAQRDW